MVFYTIYVVFYTMCMVYFIPCVWYFILYMDRVGGVTRPWRSVVTKYPPTLALALYRRFVSIFFISLYLYTYIYTYIYIYIYLFYIYISDLSGTTADLSGTIADLSLLSSTTSFGMPGSKHFRQKLSKKLRKLLQKRSQASANLPQNRSDICSQTLFGKNNVHNSVHNLSNKGKNNTLPQQLSQTLSEIKQMLTQINSQQRSNIFIKIVRNNFRKPKGKAKPKRQIPSPKGKTPAQKRGGAAAAAVGHRGGLIAQLTESRTHERNETISWLGSASSHPPNLRYVYIFYFIFIHISTYMYI